MSDKNKHKRKSLSDFIRYRSNNISGQERNSFERELQKDPFAEEAAEGFASLSGDELEKDMVHLQKRLKTRTGRRQGFMYYRIAASVALLMLISTVLIIVNRNQSGEELPEIAVLSESEELSEDIPATEPAGKSNESEKPVIIAEKKAVINTDNISREKESAQKSIPVEKEKVALAGNFDLSTEKISEVSDELVRVEQIVVPAAAMARAKTSPELIATGKVLSSEDSMPLPGASVSIKGARSAIATDTGGNFKIALPDSDNITLVADFIGMEPKEFEIEADSQVQVILDPSVSAISELVVVGYGSKRTKAEMEVNNTGYHPPEPLDGKAAFEEYIQENIRRPDSLTSGQRVVVVISFLVKTNGSADSIKIIRSPAVPFSDEAVRLIKSGPPWKPAEDNGLIIEDDVRVRIVFK